MTVEPQKSEPRVVGLDALRFVAALWVVFAHCGPFPLTEGLDRTSIVGLVVQGGYGNLFAGVPAVIVFFVISGFCVHYPYRTVSTLEVVPYLVRRYLRIGIPLLLAMLLAVPLHVNLSLFHNSILWSLAAELIYYTLYPGLLRLRTWIGWDRLIAAAYLLAYCGVLVHPGAKDYSPYGTWLNWLIAFPSWLLGCRLAEVNWNPVDASLISSRVWSWRFGIWGLSWVCSVLRFHSPLGYPWTMNLFALPVFFWLRAEIISARLHGANRSLEWAGQWSYSIYLVHMIAMSGVKAMSLPNLGYGVNWILLMGVVLLASYLFYLLVERPGHLLARRASILCRNRGGQP